ncbi:hypothetical protein [Pseudoalteromonas sp. G4]|uniref:hypothetical protein n=1 Tax=Pseudoalteromonas sp. G4 TaxID=2992761 RepID=UPI00237E827B|nr:hypothetical protein [Pseudoalteromonas sp. G4]MDE3271853.1 hypothetical protein [Pseudoalteromonas sp. G4]
MAIDQHGIYHLWCEDKIIYAELLGSWNKVAALNFARDFKQLASEFDGPWGHLVYLEGWGLCTDDGITVIKQLVDWCIENDLRRAAQIYSKSGLKEMFVGKIVVEEHGNFKRAVFDDVNHAVDWLKLEGFNASKIKPNEN